MNKIQLGIATGITYILASACTEATKTTDSTNLNWATFNIRYDNPQDGMNNWKYRKDSVASFIKHQELDIIGMQEVLDNQLNDLKDRLPEYDVVGVGREDGAKKGEYAPLFIKKSKFEIMDSNTFWLSQYPDSVGFIGWDGACTRIATWAKLKDKNNGKIFMAVNTHFDHVGVEARKNAALLIIEKIKEIVGDKPAVLTGDFNVNSSSDAYTTITTNAFVLKDAYTEAVEKSGVNYTFHDFGRIPQNECEMIDFIFVTPQIKVNSIYIPQEPEEEKDAVFMSDHNPEIVNIEF